MVTLGSFPLSSQTYFVRSLENAELKSERLHAVSLQIRSHASWEGILVCHASWEEIQLVFHAFQEGIHPLCHASSLEMLPAEEGEMEREKACVSSC